MPTSWVLLSCWQLYPQQGKKYCILLIGMYRLHVTALGRRHSNLLFYGAVLRLSSVLTIVLVTF